MIAIETARLALRTWDAADLPEFIHATNTEAVMAHLGGVASTDVFQALFERVSLSQHQNGFCFWLVERKSDRTLLGLCGFKRAAVDPVRGAMEIGWRLRQDAWGQGYAREAASACLDWAWRNVEDDRIVAITVEANHASRNLMERLGMRRNRTLDFDHPNYAPDDPLRPHITYEMERPGDGPGL
jgi:RimJ/RimL family protein N-acetyltransferase